MQPEKEVIESRITSSEASERFQDIVTYPNHPLEEATISIWDDKLALVRRSGIRKLNIRQEDIAGNKTLEEIIDTWIAFGDDADNTSNTVAWQCLTVDPPTLSKPGISYQVVREMSNCQIYNCLVNISNTFLPNRWK